MPRLAEPEPLPAGAYLQVELWSRRYPAWIERGTRRVYAACGMVGFGALILVATKRTVSLEPLGGLVAALHAYGYFRATMLVDTEMEETPWTCGRSSS